MKLGEAVYKSQQKDQPQPDDPKDPKKNDNDKENVVDADFEDVKDDKEKSA
jgi:molecular chaperone DnaK